MVKYADMSGPRLLTGQFGNEPILKYRYSLISFKIIQNDELCLFVRPYCITF